MKLKLRTALLLLLIVLLGGWIGSLAWNGLGLFRSLRALQAIGNGELNRSSMDEAIQWVHRADRHANRLYWGMAPLFPAFDLLGWLPVVGEPLRQVEPLLQYGTGLTSAGDQMLQVLGPSLVAADPVQESLPFFARLLEILVDHQAQMASAQAALERAAAARERLDFSLLPGNVEAQLRKVDEKFPLIQGGVSLLAALPALGGQEASQTYLLVVQNNDELRASGGFISAFGIVEVRNGDVVRFEVQDSYAVDDFSVGYPAPPEPLSTYMLSGYWVPRDANWSPDFPTAARQIAALYTQSTGRAVDSVLAIDQTAVVMLLQALGPVEVAGTDEAVTAHNVVAWMQRSWEPEPEEGASGTWWAQRKDFMKNLGAALLDRLMALGEPGAYLQTGVAGLQAMQAGHILLYTQDQQAQAGLAQAGLDGAVQTGPGDFLLMVDSNIGFNKADAKVSRQMQYRVDLSDPASPRASLLLDYRSAAPVEVTCKHASYYGLTYADLQNRCYWDYWRVLAAGGSQLTAGQVAAVPAERLLNQVDYPGVVQSTPAEGGAMAFSGLMVLPGGAQQLITLDWRLPQSVLVDQKGGWVYRLRIQKQPGLAKAGLRLVALAPAGCALQAADGWRAGAEPGEWVWEGSLEETLEFTLHFR